MSRSIVLGICVYVLLGSLACSGDDDGAGGGGSGAGGSGSGDGSGTGTGSGSSGSGSGSGSGPGSGSSGSGSGSGTSGSGANAGGSDGSGSGDGGVGGSSSGGGGTSATGDPNALLFCSGAACACADGVDNDNDGTMDGFDYECTGPYDDDEGTFGTGIPGDNMDPKWQDCFFDGDSGAGNDGCRYSTDCLTGDLDQDDPACVVSQMCVDFCMTRTPPGCDCFGCCTVPSDDGPVDVVISSACDANDIASCTTCVKSDLCDNECGECQLCTGVTVDDLPDDCFNKYPPPAGSGGHGGTGVGGAGGASGSGSSGNGGNGGAGGASGSGSSGNGGAGGSEPPPPYTCEGGYQLCRDQTECPPGNYCQFGCCRLIAPE